ncbi:MAG: hypothetical protein QOD11_2522 [Bradyrhizobium sp.]|nr:hypothetical protein [Bradyrhizobium sp.]
MGHKRKRPSFETPRKRAAPQDDGGVCARFKDGGHGARSAFAHPTGYFPRLPRGPYSALLTSLMRGSAASIMLR